MTMEELRAALKKIDADACVGEDDAKHAGYAGVRLRDVLALMQQAERAAILKEREECAKEADLRYAGVPHRPFRPVDEGRDSCALEIAKAIRARPTP